MTTRYQQLVSVGSFFDERYRSAYRYWWKRGNRYSIDPDDFADSLIAQQTLRSIAGRPPGRALDLGAGEGADSIRLARLGYEVTAIEISEVAAEKIAKFAANAGVPVKVEVADACAYGPTGQFDVVICNGVLHYVRDKAAVVQMMQRVTKPGGLNVISEWSTYSPVPECHEVVPVYCDDEGGLVQKLYQDWKTEFIYLDREKAESSHDDMAAHAHSHIKLIMRRIG